MLYVHSLSMNDRNTSSSRPQQDLRNHGHSFHSQDHNYNVMAEDVEEFIQQQKLDKCILIGHSMYVRPYHCNLLHAKQASLI